jgi:hypothetical protein
MAWIVCPELEVESILCVALGGSYDTCVADEDIQRLSQRQNRTLEESLYQIRSPE